MRRRMTYGWNEDLLVGQPTAAGWTFNAAGVPINPTTGKPYTAGEYALLPNVTKAAIAAAAQALKLSSGQSQAPSAASGCHINPATGKCYTQAELLGTWRPTDMPNIGGPTVSSTGQVTPGTLTIDPLGIAGQRADQEARDKQIQDVIDNVIWRPTDGGSDSMDPNAADPNAPLKAAKPDAMPWWIWLAVPVVGLVLWKTK